MIRIILANKFHTNYLLCFGFKKLAKKTSLFFLMPCNGAPKCADGLFEVITTLENSPLNKVE